MKDVAKMTPEELRKLADEKEAQENHVVVARGGLKQDIYYFDRRMLATENELNTKKKIMDDIKEAMDLEGEKGTKVELHGNRLGNNWYYTWYDDGGCFEWGDSSDARSWIKITEIFDEIHLAASSSELIEEN